MAISVILLVVVGAVAYAAARAAAARRAGPGPDGEPGRLAGDGGEGRDGPADARETVAQLFRLGLLFAAVMLTASGLSGVLAEVLGRPDELADDPARLARALAFTVVGAPALLAFGLWTRRRLHAGTTEARSPLWALYLTAGELVGLLAAVTALFEVGRWVVGEADFDGDAPARSVVWLAVWTVHAVLNRRRPSRPDQVPTAVLAGSAVGWVLTAVGAGNLLAAALEVLYDRAFADVLAGDQGRPLSRAAVSAVIGAAVWAWYWLRDGRRRPVTVPWTAYTLLLASLGSLVAAVVGTAVAGHRVLTWLFGDPETATAAAHFASLPGPLAAAAVGGFGWLHHHRVVRRRTAATTRLDVHRVADYLPAAVGLVTLTVAVTTSVAALLAALAADDQLAGDGAIAAGDVITAVTLLAVGGPVWAWFWRRAQRHAADPDELRSTPRRLYLLAIFGVAALVALGATLNVAVVLFEDIARGEAGRTTLHDLRVPLGLVLATGIIAGYHAAVYRRDRRLAPGPAPDRPHGAVLRQVIVIGAGEPSRELADSLAAELHEQFGVRVRRLERPTDRPLLTVRAGQVADAVRDGDQPVAIILVQPDGETAVITAKDR